MCLSHPRLYFYTSPHQAAKAPEILRACKLKAFSEVMDNHPSDVDFSDDFEKWFGLPAHHSPLGELETNGGDWWSTEKPRNAYHPNTETESECMIIRVVGRLGCSATAEGIR